MLFGYTYVRVNKIEKNCWMQKCWSKLISFIRWTVIIHDWMVCELKRNLWLLNIDYALRQDRPLFHTAIKN